MRSQSRSYRRMRAIVPAAVVLQPGSLKPICPSVSATSSRRSTGLSSAMKRCFSAGASGSSSLQRLASQPQSSQR